VNRRTVALTERRTRVVQLPREEANFLLAQTRNLIDVVPAPERGVYRLTPRGYVGYFDGPALRYAIGPKIPWPNLCLLLGLSDRAAGGTEDPEGGLLTVLATAFVERLEAVTRAGLVAGYGQVQIVAPFLKGKLRSVDQIRDATTRAVPNRFHVDEPVFDLHTPWNRVPKATLNELLRRRVELSEALCQRLEAAALPFGAIPDEPATESDFATAYAEPRAAGYRSLLDVCRLILNGFTCADPLGAGTGAFLIDLGRAFEHYLSTGLQREFTRRTGWNVVIQPSYLIGPTTLQPDLLILKDTTPWAVLDAKWKTANPEADDLHQVLAYATLTGAPNVGLVYPGKSDDLAHFATPGRRVRVSMYPPCTGCASSAPWTSSLRGSTGSPWPCDRNDSE
jgi:5-methylcytosine-specific restriction enzyme subunit McrC